MSNPTTIGEGLDKTKWDQGIRAAIVAMALGALTSEAIANDWPIACSHDPIQAQCWPDGLDIQASPGLDQARRWTLTIVAAANRKRAGDYARWAYGQCLEDTDTYTDKCTNAMRTARFDCRYRNECGPRRTYPTDR